MGIQAFTPQGNTIVFTANTAAPAGVQAIAAGLGSNQYLVVNPSSTLVFLGAGTTAALANTSAVVVSNSQPSVPLGPGSTQVLTFAPNSFFTGITSNGAAAIYITPGEGL